MAARHKTSRKRKCPHCDYASASRSEWQRHKRMHASQRSFACPSCDWMFVTEGRRDVHVKQVHEREGRVPCSWNACGATFANARTMQAHLESVHLDQRFSCPVEGCTFTTLWKTHVHRHIRAAHSDAVFTCPVKGCDFRSAYSSYLAKHRRAKHEKIVHSCSHEDCSFTTVWPLCLKRHVRRKHSSKQGHLVSCHVCGERIDERLHVKHLQTHAQEDGHPFKDCLSCQEVMGKAATVHPDLNLLLNDF